MNRLPVALTCFRFFGGLGFIPLVLGHAQSGWLVTWLAVGFLSDIADGVLARRLSSDTLALRRLDTKADLVFYGCATITALIVAAFPMNRLWPWLSAYGVLFVARNAVDFLRYRASPSYHMWSGKLWSVLLFAHLVLLFCGAHALILLPLAFGCYAVNALEGIVASLVMSQPSKDIPSVWHVFMRHRNIDKRSLCQLIVSH